ncbi:AGAP005651-PA [Anopheles gambiae str. PEST]|uniref:Cytoplasmic tRNA 2-thiolation protein 2 n=1 Tax=Anopheles gambiae TaxID=7165 RepID=CTU2_ANOGA|nr:RecName: Full=Cytoplasmic tRNA 2-thiolation protein 2 [Anopheles gambiae]EAU76478.2 AGAP005651-PA [Anopheles gambiae str. PEST]
MCSIVEDDFGDEGGAHAMKEDTPQPELGGNELCRKCNTEQAVLKLNQKEPQCRVCFLNYVRHKFRASLGSTKIVRRGSRVLIILTGEPANVTLLDMVRFGLEQDAFKQLRIVPVLLYVDDDFVGNTSEARLQQLAERLQVFKQFESFPAYYTVCGSSRHVALTFDGAFSPAGFEQDEARLLQVLDAVRSVSSKQDLLEQVRKQTYRQIGHALQCAYVFLSDIGVDLAKTLLSNVALGRGCSLAQDVAFCDDRYNTVKLVRPIRDLNPDEVSNYLQYSEQPLLSYSPAKHFEDKPSLQNLTAKFIDNLMQSFPSTVSTVYRTGDKLDAPKAARNECCRFCGAALDYRGSKTLFATEYSRLVSSRINAACSHEDILLKSKQMELDAERAVNGEDDQGEERVLMKQLCHGCRNIFEDLNK